jgi:hypothetical protein
MGTIAAAFFDQSSFELYAELDWIYGQELTVENRQQADAIERELETRAKRRQYLIDYFG